MTIACIDVAYTEIQSKPTTAVAACVLIDDWSDSAAASEHVIHIDDVQNYQPGQFYLRELPCIEAVLAELSQLPTCVVIDGYAWLDDQDTPGLGAHLYEALNQTVPVIGVAKNAFKGSLHATELHRGDSVRPLYITAVGMRISEATRNIANMHGPHRFPTVLKRVDRLSRAEHL